MRFRIRLFDPASGAVRTVVAEGADEAAVRGLHAGGREIVVAAQPLRRFAWRLPGSGTAADIGLLCIELARLLRAGLTLPEAIETQMSRVQEPARSVYAALRDRLLEGKRLSDAMEAGGHFPLVLTAAVRASERSGRVADALEEYARYDQSIRELRRKLVNSAIYPATVIGFGVLVSLFLLGYVVPRFAGIFEGTAAHATRATGLLLAFGGLVNRHAEWIVVLLLVATVGATLLLRDPRLRAALLTRVAVAGPVARWLRRFQLARITHAMAMLLSNGFTVPDAMRLASALAVQPDLATAMTQASGRIDAGQSASVSWTAAGLADAYATRVLQAGERTGNLAGCFDTLAQTYRADVETALERATRLVEPILLMVVATLIGTIVVLMYMPIFDLAGSLG